MDPVDHARFVVLELPPDTSLADRLATTTLAASELRVLAAQMLEVCQQLSRSLGREALWLATEPEFIHLRTPGAGFTPCFEPDLRRWPDPGESSAPDLRPLLTLIEHAGGWSGSAIRAQTGEGLGTWLLRLRRHRGYLSLDEAREALAAPADKPSPACTPGIPAAPPRSISTTRPGWHLPTALALSLIAAILVVLTHKSRSRPTSAERAEPPVISSTTGRLSSGSPALLTVEPGREHTVEARVDRVRASSSGLTIYLEFDEPGLSQIPCARYQTRNESLDPGQLDKFAGHTVRIAGTVVRDPSQRLAIDLTSLSQIEILR